MFFLLISFEWICDDREKIQLIWSGLVFGSFDYFLLAHAQTLPALLTETGNNRYL